MGHGVPPGLRENVAAADLVLSADAVADLDTIGG